MIHVSMIHVSMIHVEASSMSPRLTIFHSSNTFFKRACFLKISTLVKICLIKIHAKFRVDYHATLEKEKRKGG